MTIPNVTPTPRIWLDTELEREAAQAIQEFVDRRLAETSSQYVAFVQGHRKSIIRLFQNLKGVNPEAPDAEIIRKILLDPELFDALRYMAGPPVSEDDLGVLVTREISGFSKAGLRKSDDLVAQVLQMICRLADPVRLPWVGSRKGPSNREIRDAIGATAVLHATQSLQTARRGYGKVVERKLQQRLCEIGFSLVAAPAKGLVNAPFQHPVFPQFFGECTVYGRKVDLLIPLRDGRVIALEAKDSSSALNSLKRLNNDTAAKARHYTVEGGRNILSVALLSGVFKLKSLQQAQNSGLFLVWAHDLEEFIDWIKSHG